MVPERMAGWRWSDRPPDEDKRCSVALGGLGGTRRSRRRAPVGGHAIMLASDVRGHGSRVGGLADVGDTSRGCDMSGHMVPCRDDMALVLDGLRAAQPASDGLEGVSEVRTCHLACGTAMETSHGIGRGRRHVLMMAAWLWGPHVTCSSLGCMWGTHSVRLAVHRMDDGREWQLGCPKDVPCAIVMFQ